MISMHEIQNQIMKIIATSKWIAASLFLGALVFSACEKNSTTKPPVQNPTVAQVIQSGTNLTIWNAALMRAGLDTLLSNPDSLVTVFVATDQIMTAAGLTAAVIDTMSIPSLQTFLEYSIYSGNKVMSTTFPAGPDAPWQMSSGDSVFITYTGTQVYVDGINVPTTDVNASNGYIDVLAQPLFPPTGTILQITQADTTLSYFDTAVARTASSTLVNIQALLNSGSIYTVLVPNNNAFRNAGLPNTVIDTLNPDTLSRLLSYHMITNRYFTSDINIALSNNPNSNDTTTETTLLGSAIKVILSYDYQAEGNSDSTAANLYAPNIMARNGVVHKIDQVLHP
jgi:transforming growth factor-beta-induced protein